MSKDPPPLTPDQQAESEALWRQVKHYERMGVRMVIVSTGEQIRLRPVGQAVDLPVYGNISITK